jgi:hypothetical protein
VNKTEQLVQGASQEHLDHELKGIETQAESRAIPVNWQDGVSKQRVKGRSLVQAPSEEETRMFADKVPREVCGHCKHFDLESGRKEIARQQFIERVVLEEGWKQSHLGPLDMMGLCGASGGQTATTYVAKSCDHFQLRRK